MIVIREVTADDWALMRDVRLSALADAPDAFGSTYAREAVFTEEQWRGRISERSITFFAREEPPGRASLDQLPDDAGPVGLSGVYVENGAANLVSMWVRPSARGLGAGRHLVEAAAAWARERDFNSLFLWVTESNEPARRLYERCGFTPTGERQPLPSNPALQEIAMSRAL
jgi:ribosomal protein S18 acetylase RimI-like enzyme